VHAHMAADHKLSILQEVGALQFSQSRSLSQAGRVPGLGRRRCAAGGSAQANRLAPHTLMVGELGASLRFSSGGGSGSCDRTDEIRDTW
jgi:hypothetical protein